MKKHLATFLILQLVVPQGFLLPPAASAQAVGGSGGFLELSAVFFAEGSRTFGPGETITIAGAIPFVAACPGMLTGFPPVGRGEGRFDPFPTADIYVIKDTGQPLGILEKLSDASGGVNRLVGLSSGAFVDEVVAVSKPAGNLDAGRYDIVMDQCLDGHFDPGIDIVLGEGAQFAFEVVLPGNLPPINLHPLKQAASMYALALDGKTISVPGGGQIVIPGFCKYFAKWENSAAINAASTLGIWTAIARNKCVDLVKHYQGIAADPPDPNFTQFAELGALDYHVATANTALERAMRTLAGTLSEQAAIAKAMLTTLERFQGAELAGDHLYMFLQLEELKKQITLMIGPGGSVLRFYAALEMFDLALSQDPLGQSADAQALRAFLPEIRRAIGGLMTPVAGTFMRKFISASQEVLVPIGLQGWVIVYLGLDPFLPALGLPSIAAVRQFSGLPPLAFQHPNASAGGPYTAPPGTLISFDATKSADPNGDALSFAWDLDGDGDFDDATGAAVQHAFPHAGTQLVGVKATDPAGNSDVSYSFARAGDVNTQDVIAMSNREAMWRISPTGAVTTLRPALPAITNPGTLRVDLNGDIWVMKPSFGFPFPTGVVERYDSNGVLLSTITRQQIEALVGFNILNVRDFVLDGRGDIILTIQEDLGPGMREWIDFPQFNRFAANIGGRTKVLRLAKDGSRASVIADVDDANYQVLRINGQLVVRDFAARPGGIHFGSLAINPDGDIVVGGVNNLYWPGNGFGVYTMDPDSGAMTEVLPDDIRGLLAGEPPSGRVARPVGVSFGGVAQPSWGAVDVSARPQQPGIEVDPQGNYLYGVGASGAGQLRLGRIPIPPQITDFTFPGLIITHKLIEVFPLNLVIVGGPFLINMDMAVDSAGDILVAGSDFHGMFPPGIFRVTPDGQFFQMAVTPPVNTSGSPRLLDVVPTIRTVTPKDIPPPPSVQLSNLVVNQQGCPGEIDISVTLTNTGSQPLTHSVRVLFWDGDPGAGGTVIGATEVQPPLAAGAGAIASFTWSNPPAGTRTIFVTAEGGNSLSRSLFVCVPLPAAGSDSIVLAPATASVNLGTQHTVTATLLDLHGQPFAGAPIDFQVSGANSASGIAVTDASGVATFQYSGTNSGQDTIFASFLGATSNDASVDWQGAPVDMTPPVLALPGTITVEATSPAGAAASYTASALDTVDGVVTPACTPASGSTFPLGQTTVTCTATDAAGNTAQGSFDVIVSDTTPPALAQNPDLSVPATGPGGAMVNFALPAASDVADSNPVVACLPASGTNFPLGTTPVLCTATDASGNQAQTSFNVTVAVGLPRISGLVIAKGSDASGALWYDVRLANSGTGHARNLRIQQVLLRTLGGSGTATYNATLSPALPLNLGSLDVGATTVVRFYLNVPGSVTRFSITETGTVQDVLGTSYTYSAGQATYR